MSIETINHIAGSAQLGNGSNGTETVVTATSGSVQDNTDSIQKNAGSTLPVTKNTKSSKTAATEVSSNLTEAHEKSAEVLDQLTEKEQNIREKAKEVNKKINRNTVAEFGYNDPTNRITIKIKDKDTQEVIKEIPSEKALEMLEKAWEIAGILVDEKR